MKRNERRSAGFGRYSGLRREEGNANTRIIWIAVLLRVLIGTSVMTAIGPPGAMFKSFFAWTALGSDFWLRLLDNSEEEGVLTPLRWIPNSGLAVCGNCTMTTTNVDSGLRFASHEAQRHKKRRSRLREELHSLVFQTKCLDRGELMLG